MTVPVDARKVGIAVSSIVRPALVLFSLLTVLTGVIYPVAVTGIANVAFAANANGSLVTQGGRVVGSALVGQGFDQPKYLWGRLSGTTPGYNAASSSGSNYGPMNPALLDAVKARAAALHAADPANTRPIPVDLATASGSGLDPHITPAAADYQIARVARARGIDEARVRAVVATCTEGRSLGFLGEPRVNVLAVNLALDALP